jgi:isopenicillin N synthase-like dioxygenase
VSDSFDADARERELRDEAESWDTGAPVPAEPGDIPVIDVRSFLAAPEGPGRATTTAAAVRSACEEVGFFQLIGHGVDKQLVNDAFAAARSFHDLNDASKEAIAMDRPGATLPGVGYLRIGERLLPRRSVGNLNEAFLIKGEAGVGFEDNAWPDPAAVPGFRQAIEAYAIAISGLAQRLVPLYALALELPSTFFDGAFVDPFWRLRLTRYPGVRTTRPAGAFGIAPHVDTTFFTLLRQDGPGLTIYSTARDAWMTAPVIEEAFVVNTGELLRQWSNDRFLSVRHFADNPSTEPRHSLPFFFNANADHVMHPVPTCVSAANPARYAPVSYRQSQASAQGE